MSADRFRVFDTAKVVGSVLPQQIDSIWSSISYFHGSCAQERGSIALFIINCWSSTSPSAISTTLCKADSSISLLTTNHSHLPLPPSRETFNPGEWDTWRSLPSYLTHQVHQRDCQHRSRWFLPHECAFTAHYVPRRWLQGLAEAQLNQPTVRWCSPIPHTLVSASPYSWYHALLWHIY